MPEHLALATNALESTNADIYWSRAAFFANRGAWSDRVFFDEVSPKKRRLEDTYDCPFYLAEPMSAWVAQRGSLNRLGPMKLASETAQMPIVEYCQRAFQAGLSLEAGDDITVLKDRVWHAPPSYQNTADYAEAWVQQIEAGQTEGLRQTIDDELWLSLALGLSRPFEPVASSNGQSSKADIDRETGLNMAEVLGLAKTQSRTLLGQTLEIRTGKSLGQQPQIENMVSFARRAIQ